MPRQSVTPLTAAEVAKISKPGFTRVGGVSGLVLKVQKSGSRSWALRLTFGGRRQDVGLGSYPSVTLAMARERARQILDERWAGRDVLAERKAARAAVAAGKASAASPSFDEVARQFAVARLGHLDFKNRRLWHRTIEAYASPVAGSKAIGEVSASDVLRILGPLWQTKTTTASRLRGSLEAILDFASAMGWRSTANPAKWRGSLQALLPSPARTYRSRHFPALAYHRAPSFISQLRGEQGIAVAALEYLILTAARAGEVRGATWDEINLDTATWTISGDKMKGGRLHRVPLSRPALAILERAPRFAASPLVFPGSGGVMNGSSLAALVKRIEPGITVHGFRSTFRDWVSETTQYPNELAELALEHVVKGVEGSYRRMDQLDKRRAMMADWAAFLEG